jgi:hypothetical protein
MENVNVTVQGTKLQIIVDLSKAGKPSSTGKSLILATTGGNVLVEPKKGIKLGLNVYQPVANLA